MNKPVWLARWLGACGLLEIATGLTLLAAPAAVAYGLLRLSPDGHAAGRLAGATLLALGLAGWRARRHPLERVSRVIARILLAYNLAACAALAWAAPALNDGGIPARAAAVLHGGLGLALAVSLFGRRRLDAETPTLEN
ncbi:MAG: hypothetical protein KA248_07245 [Kiritimatiellae bacterium]|nr:hypothetical protein [Kiritimatiellia bacterium]